MSAGYLVERFSLKGDPALAKAIRNKKLDECVKLLTDGADPNVPDSSEDYPIHIAVMVYDVTLVKLLIIFYADLTKKNKAGYTPLQLAEKEGKKAHECYIAIKNVVDLQNARVSVTPRQWGAKTPPRAIDDDVYLLTLDGGGIRGLVFIQVLLGIEQRRKQLYPDSNTFLSYFNWIGGNSTGGLAGLALAGLKASLEQGRKLYLTLKDNVFTGQIPYNSDDVIKSAFGTARSMSSIIETNVTIMTTIGVTAPPKLHIMSNYGGERDGQIGPDKRLIWEAARATSAAVPYFHPFGDFMDGGFIANNPTCDTIVDIQKYKKNSKLKVVLSMGCGFVTPVSITEPDFNPLPNWLDKIMQMINKKELEEALFLLKNIPGALSLAKLMASQITQPCAEVNERSKALAESVGAKFYRFNPRTSDTSFVESKNAPIIDMMYEAMVGTLEDPDVDNIIDTIVGNAH